MKVRCKRCSETFRVEPELGGGEVYVPASAARQAESRRARDADLFAGVASAGAEAVDAARVSSASEALETRDGMESPASGLTGERNESSVLFSLATLAKGPVMTSSPAATESSALIDIRALCLATSTEDATASRADDIVNLSGGGAFAPLFAPPLAPPVTFVPEQEVARGRHVPIALLAIALGVLAVVGVGAFASVRARAPMTQDGATGGSPPAYVVPLVASALTARPEVVQSPAESPMTPPVAPAPIAMGRPSVPSGAGSSTSARGGRAMDPRPAASQAAAASTVAAPSRCCPGESDTACHMRLAVGAACGESSSSSISSTAPPFDRSAAARALGVNVASCKRADGPTGAGHVRVTFEPRGTVSAVDVEAPFGGTATGACIAQRYKAATVPAFSGGSLTVGKSFAIE